ncbi:MAG: BspA family leucine-rich repeat surface protein, partial [Lactobacillus sp.]|nr:BspA family leucine-rich repeat surface protein [Lactobacillus sp.]
MKIPNLIKFEKTGIGIATMALGLVVTVQSNLNVAAATPTVVPISATGLPSDAGLWTGTDGSCTWKYDVISRTLRISGAQKSSQLSSTPFLKQFKWSGNIEHIVFETPIQMAPNSAEKFAGLEYLEDITGLDKVDTSQVTNMALLFTNDKALTKADVSHFDTSQVTSMERMFDNTALTEVDLSGFNT